jgi:choline monooxygenase
MNLPAAHPTKDRFDADPARSYTLRSRYYIDPAVYEREKEAIFYRTWNYVCHAGAVGEIGGYATARIADQEIFAIRGKDGTLRGFHNVCSHRAHQLVKGAGKAKVITCPYHAWSYHADGRLRTARGSEKVDGFRTEEFCLKPVRVEEYAGFVFANLDSDAAPLAGQAGDLEKEIRHHCPDLDRLKFVRRLTYEVKANWKNVVDNYLECYHCTPAHPAFAELVDIKDYRSVTHDIYSSHIGPAGSADNAAYKFSAEDPGQKMFAGFWLWPTLTFNTFPGCGNMTLLHIMPTGPETTREHFDFFFANDPPTPDEEAAIEYVDKVLQPEDIGLVESVQRGLHSRAYDQGRFIVDAERTFISEHAMHHFHGLVLEALRA